MAKGHIIGVDGGNTKTDYFLFGIDGSFTGHIRSGSCSHEAVGYEEAERLLNEKIGELLKLHGLGFSDIKAGAFGLAGVDIPPQREKFDQIFHKMGIPKFVVANDSFLGIVAGTSKGYGVCSVNGTGTVSGGIDPEGNILQVGGIGPLVGDDAGGGYIARAGVRAVYDSYYRCGDKTLMSEPMFKLLGIEKPEQLMTAISGNILFGTERSEELTQYISETDLQFYATEMTRVIFKAVNAGDGPAFSILEYVGDQLAKTSAGCVRNLKFGKSVEIVLIGSVWVKADSPVLYDAYKRRMAFYLPEKTLKYNILKVPPATGAVLWALSLLGVDCFHKDVKASIVSAVEQGLA